MPLKKSGKKAKPSSPVVEEARVSLRGPVVLFAVQVLLVIFFAMELFSAVVVEETAPEQFAVSLSADPVPYVFMALIALALLLIFAL